MSATLQVRHARSFDSSTEPALTYASSLSDAEAVLNPTDHHSKRFGLVSKPLHHVQLPRRASAEYASTRKHQRIRVNSNNSSPPLGFPYVNSTHLLEPYSSQADHGNTSISSDNSSDDVDLDLSLDHVGINMDNMHHYQDWWSTSQQMQNNPLVQPTLMQTGKDRSSDINCSSTQDLRSQFLQGERLAQAEDWTKGFSFNRTSIEDLNLRTKRTGASPFRLFVDKALRSPTASLSTSSLFSRRDSRGLSDLASPVSDSLMTPHTPHSFVTTPQVKIVNDNHSNSLQTPNAPMSEFGRLDSKKTYAIDYSSPATTYQTAPSLPSTTASRDQMTGIPPLSPGLHGLGLQSLDLRVSSPDPIHASTRSRSPSYEHLLPLRSPASSVGSPSPDSPLLAVPSPAPQQVSFSLPSDHPSLATPSRITRLLTLIQSKTESASASCNADSSPRPFRKYLPPHPNWQFPRSWLEEASPAQLFFFLGLVMPVFFIVGGIFLRPDGEFYGQRGAVCRCRRRKLSDDGIIRCPVEFHRALRLMGSQSTGDGLLQDALQQHVDVDQMALLNFQLPKRNGYVLANRIMAVISSVSLLAAFCFAWFAVCTHW